MELIQIVKKFKLDGEIINVEPYGNGHINTTYVVNCINKGVPLRYILQKINTNVFPRTEELMRNIIKVTQYMRDIIIADGGDPERETLTLVETTDGNFYYKSDANEYYRVYVFVEDTVALQIAEDLNMFEETGRAFGNFIKKLNDFPASDLEEVILNFHNTSVRFKNFKSALEKNYNNRSEKITKEIEFVLSRESYCDKVVNMLVKGDLPLRVTHNDTKLNNVLIDVKTNKPICVIDLDTIMPGSLLYDFGDAIRSGCNTGLEDEPDLSKVSFDINLYEAFVKGFMDGIGNCITLNERNLLAFGAILMTFECGMRFLTDYLDGDNYFKTHYDDHNLVRARTQFKMVEDMESQIEKMNKIAEKYSKQ